MGRKEVGGALLLVLVTVLGWNAWPSGDTPEKAALRLEAGSEVPAIGLDRLRILPGDTVTGQKTSVAAGKYITRRAYVEIITDGQGYSATRAEFQITRWLSVLSSISTIGRQSATVKISKDY